MDPAETGRRGKDRDITGTQAIHRLLIGIHPQETSVFGHVDFVGVTALQVSEAGVQAIRKDIRHGHKFDGAASNRKCVGRCTGASTTAADEGNLQRTSSARREQTE